MTTTIRLTMRAVPPARYKVLREDGRTLLASTRTPVFSAARALLEEGAEPTAVIVAFHEGAEEPFGRMSVGEAAKWTISETDRGALLRVPWKPFSMGVSGSYVEPQDA